MSKDCRRAKNSAQISHFLMEISILAEISLDLELVRSPENIIFFEISLQLSLVISCREYVKTTSEPICDQVS